MLGVGKEDERKHAKERKRPGRGGGELTNTKPKDTMLKREWTDEESDGSEERRMKPKTVRSLVVRSYPPRPPPAYAHNVVD